MPPHGYRAGRAPVLPGVSCVTCFPWNTVTGLCPVTESQCLEHIFCRRDASQGYCALAHLVAHGLVMAAEIVIVGLTPFAGTGIKQACGRAVGHGITTGWRRSKFDGINNLAGDDIVMLTQSLQVTPGVSVHGIEVTEDVHEATRAGDAVQS